LESEENGGGVIGSECSKPVPVFADELLWNKYLNTVDSKMSILPKFYKIIDLEGDAIKSCMFCCLVVTI